MLSAPDLGVYDAPLQGGGLMVMAHACVQRIGCVAAFKLPTVAAEAVPLFREAGHADAPGDPA